MIDKTAYNMMIDALKGKKFSLYLSSIPELKKIYEKLNRKFDVSSDYIFEIEGLSSTEYPPQFICVTNLTLKKRDYLPIKCIQFLHELESSNSKQRIEEKLEFYQR